jgi:GNAT superfamily N-acetyltransferase
MYKIEILDDNNIGKIKSLYENFLERSYDDYKFELQPLSFDIFEESAKEGFIKGFVLEENGTPACFLLYVDSLNEAVELNLIHCLDEKNINEKRKEITKAFTKYVKEKSDKKVISYPMMGIQSNFVQEIAALGYKLVGQTIEEFNFQNPTCLQLAEKSKTIDLPQDYSIDSWKSDYFDEVVEIIHNQFKDAPDSLFDPRFKTIEGTKTIVTHIVENIYGDFSPEKTTVLKFNDEVCGICFVNMTTNITANVPIVAIKRPHHLKGFGALILKHTITKLREIRESNNLLSINATTDTDNYPAVRMYRKIGFKEIYTYPHAYLKL